MAISRYWRLVGMATPGNGPLELSEVRIYEGGVLADASATLTATIAPASGALADLRDGLATEVVLWPYASYSQPGFALVWDFGAGGGVEFPALRLGSGSSAATFPVDLAAQSSVDGVNWTFFSSVSNVVFSDLLTLTPVPSSVTDPYFNSVALLLHGNGADGSTNIVDSSPSPKTVTPSGTARISTAQSKFGGSSIRTDLSPNTFLSLPALMDSVFLNNFTLEVFVCPVSWGSSSILLSANVDGGLQLGRNGVGNLGVARRGLAWVLTGSALPAVGAWSYIKVTCSANALTIGLNGVSIGSATLSTPFVAGQLKLSDASFPFDGYFDELRITPGVARDPTNFAVPTVAFPESSFIQIPSSIASARKTAPTPERLFPATDLPPTTAHGHLREFPFFDVFNGGIGLITGTVKEKSLPANVPLARKVWLMDEASGMVVRETWSDAATGAYEFRGVKQGVKYTVLAYDYTGAYRAVVADRITPEITA